MPRSKDAIKTLLYPATHPQPRSLRGGRCCSGCNASLRPGFRDLKTALVDYSKADREPRKTCDALGLQVERDRADLGGDDAGERGCSRPLSRHRLAFSRDRFRSEPAAAWNGRFYMIGNGGHAGEALDDAGRVGAAQRGLAASGSPSRRRTPATTRARNRRRPS